MPGPAALSALAALAALLVAAPPFPAPRLAVVTEKTRCDTGAVLRVEPAELRVTTPAGVVTYKAGPDVQVFDAAGQPAGAVSKLQPGTRVRVYYVVDDGARALEVDLE